MRKSMLAALLVAASMAVFASSAAAFPIRVAPGGAISASGLRYNVRALGGLISITCDVTLSGTINSSITGTTTGGAGSITAGRVANCNYPTTLLVSTSNPWPLTALTLLGDNPLTGILGRIDNAQFQVQNLPLVGTCLVSGAVNFLIPLASSVATRLTTLASTFANSTCGISASDSGGQVFSITPSQTVTR